MAPQDTIVTLGPDAGKEIIPSSGRGILLRADGDDTAGAYTVLEMAVPGATPGPPAHVRRESEEAWFVLEGMLTFQLGDQTFEASAGSFVLAPRGTVHSFRNVGPQPARWLTIFSPPGMEGYFRERAHQGLAYRTASREEIQALARKYKFEFV